jgi:thiol:disulfide interchange protein DsbC
MVSRVCFFLISLVATAAWADDQSLRRIIESKLNGAKIEGVQPSPIPGLMEVRFRTPQGVQILYADPKGENIIQGEIYESRTGRNLTEERITKLSAIKFDSLPLDKAVKIVRGNGKRALAMFSDPHCPYCVKFEQALQQVDDITVYVFMFPVIRPERIDDSRSVWCASDRAKAWLDLALRKLPPAAAKSCDNPVDSIVSFGKSIGINGTPTVFFENGERASGMSLAALRTRLDQVAKDASQAKGR